MARFSIGLVVGQLGSAIPSKRFILACVIVNHLLTLEYDQFSKLHAKSGKQLSQGGLGTGKRRPADQTSCQCQKPDTNYAWIAYLLIFSISVLRCRFRSRADCDTFPS